MNVRNILFRVIESAQKGQADLATRGVGDQVMLGRLPPTSRWMRCSCSQWLHDRVPRGECAPSNLALTHICGKQRGADHPRRQGVVERRKLLHETSGAIRHVFSPWRVTRGALVRSGYSRSRPWTATLRLGAARHRDLHPVRRRVREFSRQAGAPGPRTGRRLALEDIVGLEADLTVDGGSRARRAGRPRRRWARTIRDGEEHAALSPGDTCRGPRCAGPAPRRRPPIAGGHGDQTGVLPRPDSTTGHQRGRSATTSSSATSGHRTHRHQSHRSHGVRQNPFSACCTSWTGTPTSIPPNRRGVLVANTSDTRPLPRRGSVPRRESALPVPNHDGESHRRRR